MLLLTLGGAACAHRAVNDALKDGVTQPIRTVSGAIPPEMLGVTLMHEHVLVDFIGADQVTASRYDANHAFTTVLPYLEEARALGCRTLSWNVRRRTSAAIHCCCNGCQMRRAFEY